MSDCEKLLIGLCMREGDIEEALNCGVKEEMFCTPRAAEAWSVMLNLRDNHRTIDLPAVATQCISVSADLWLVEALTDAPVGKAAHWANEVVDAAITRSLCLEASSLAQMGLRRRPFDGTQELFTRLAAIQEKFVDAASSTTQSRDMKAIVLDLIADIDSSTAKSVKSGFKIIDNTYGGFCPPDLWIIAARPSMGKTTFAVNCAANSARLGKRPVYFTAEMRDTQIVLKEISRMCKVSLTKIRSNVMTTDEMDRFVAASNEICNLGWSINYAAAREIETIENETRRLHRMGKCDIVFIDYLQLIHAAGKWDSRHSEITYITGRLKRLAIDLNIPVVACAQVNRELDRSGKKPNWRGLLTMLKDSGSIEQDADVVMFIEGEERSSEIDLIFAKVRFGDRVKSKCASNLAVNSFSDANYRVEET
jgi:replicative DNA helicase